MPLRTIAEDEGPRALVTAGMNEVIALAMAREVLLPAELPDQHLALAKTLPPDWKTSMCNDLEAGRKIELRSLSGSAHRLGQELDVSTPVHSFAWQALSPYAA